MKLAILFWCYKNLSICKDRVRHLRRHNPHTPIFVLFGGEPAEAEVWQRALAGDADDFYVFDGEPPPGSERFHSRFRGGTYWKYTYGDLLIAAWHRDRGVHLEWDSVAVVQWDMLIYGPIEKAFACLEKGQVLFSGLRPVSEVIDSWLWTTHPRDRADYDEFITYLRERYGYDDDPVCCVAIVMCFPREFLRQLGEIERPELGFLEYRLPIYAQVFGVPFCREHPFRPWWGAVERFRLTHTLRARPREIWAPVIAWNVWRRDGARVFHPYWRRAPSGALGWTVALADAVPRLVITGVVRAVRRSWRLVMQRVSRHRPAWVQGT